MNRLSIILTIAVFFVIFDVSAKKNDPHADIKVGYTYHNCFVRGSDGIITRDISFVLLANKGQSKFYSPHTEFLDSLGSSPQGRIVSRQLRSDALKRYSETGDESYMNSTVYHTFLYVFRSLPENKMTVYDRVGSLEHGYYTEPLGEIEWEISDSTKTVLGYDCVMATANYHGREWTAWFAPDIPMQEGPWKLAGLPGLILEATDASSQHGFEATGLEASTQEIAPIYPYRQYDKMPRIEMLRQQRYYNDHHNSINAASTGIKFGTDHIHSEDEAKIDFLETDYHK